MFTTSILERDGKEKMDDGQAYAYFGETNTKRAIFSEIFTHGRGSVQAGISRVRVLMRWIWYCDHYWPLVPAPDDR
jgi:hypothetical protein